MTTTDVPRYAPQWLELREPADAAARSTELAARLHDRLAGRAGLTGELVVHDLGCGTGSMGRWLAPRLPAGRPQRWVLHDHDADLLALAAQRTPRTAGEGSTVTVTTRQGDLTGLTADVLTDASLVTASALLDVLTHDQVEALAEACTGAGCPVLLALSVVGKVEIAPAEPLDAAIAAAFNDHQRRDGLLGPEAVAFACDAFERRGATVRTEASAWRLGPADRELTAQWLRGWVDAACEQRPDLRGHAQRYLRRRLAECSAGELSVVVHHRDVLALPGEKGGAR
ncbi:methyltransferase domain-containing protein [Streptomyces sp. NPDC002004]